MSTRASHCVRVPPAIACVQLILAAAVVLGAAVGKAAEPPPARSVDDAINAGLSFIARQQADDGSFSAGAAKTRETALALMAFLSAGHVQDIGRYGLTVRRSVDFLTKTSAEATTDSLGQAIALVALAEAYAVEPQSQTRSQIRAILERGSQGIGGGPVEDELSTAVWQALALRAIRNVGVEVSQARLDQALSAMMKFSDPAGGFSDRAAGGPSVAATAAALLVLRLWGNGEAPAAVAAERFLAAAPANAATTPQSLFFLVQSGAAAKEPNPHLTWRPAADLLIAQQSTDGGWAEALPQNSDRLYNTAVALMTLGTPLRLIATLQK